MNEWVSLQSIPKSAVTSGGLCQVWGVPVEWIESIPRESPLTQMIEDTITLVGSRAWIPFLWSHPTRVFTEEGKIQNGQPYWEQKLTGSVYWNPTGQHIQAGNMLFHRWVFLVKEAGTGNYYLIGKPSSGAKLTVAYTSKTGTKTEITATVTDKHRACLYLGDPPVAAEEGDLEPLQIVPRAAVTSGGLCQVWGVPVEWVENVPRENPLTQIIDETIALVNGTDWIPFVWAHPSRAFNEEGKIQNGQPYWEQKLTGSVYWNPAGQHIQTNNMMQHRWVFLVKESGTGNYYLIGRPGSGAKISTAYNSRPGTKTELVAVCASKGRSSLYAGTLPGEVDIDGIFAPQFAIEFV